MFKLQHTGISPRFEGKHSVRVHMNFKHTHTRNPRVLLIRFQLLPSCRYNEVCYSEDFSKENK